MRYLIVGNGHSIDYNKIRHADAVIQINACVHAESIPDDKRHAVFVTNVGAENTAIIGSLLAKQHLFSGITLHLARNPLFYRLKAFAATRAQSWIAPCYALNHGWDRLPWPVATVPLASTIALEFLLRRRKMPRSLMPSTGMVAYYVTRRKMRPDDSLHLTGFTFEGWSGHPWQIERQIARDIYPPLYRDDPSYEKRPGWL